MKTLYMIGGTMGVGKTSVCQQLKQDLQNSVFLDGDWCWDANPFQVTEETKTMVLDNICYILNNFLACSSYENIIFCWVMHKQNIINSIIEKIDINNCVLKCISLMVDEINLRNRLSIDIAKGLRSTNIIDKSVTRISMYSSLKTFKIDTNNKTVTMISEEIQRL